MSESGDSLHRDLHALIPEKRLIRDSLRRLAYGTDASFYRLIPRLVAIVENEAEVKHLLQVCRNHRVPVTFRAAGTSLSGQAVTDGVLAVLGENWGRIAIGPGAETVTLQPGVIGGDANLKLKPFNRKIGPDPASINAAKIGGIAANNASGMCCGTAQNSYRTLSSLRVILADGAVLDTGDMESVASFRKSHGNLLAGLESLIQKVNADATLSERIKSKFKIKNTTGYSLNALIDFNDPVDALAHLMIGSEGTLGFISEITLKTVPEHPNKATALILFENLHRACTAVQILKGVEVAAVELMDGAALRAVAGKPGMPKDLAKLGHEAAALLVEVRAADPAGLERLVRDVHSALEPVPTVVPIAFTSDAAQCDKLWKVRKGLFPAVGAVRKAGTTVIIEDVAFPIERLADATLDLEASLHRHGYDEAIIFGHALEGNLHFVFTQDFGHESEVERYRLLMDEVCELVVRKYGGSLKAEHGTGRNMAPFVELEWGAEAYRLMWELKRLFDPENQLNPGVVLNEDPEIHLKNLKPLPAADALVDTCIECGFCERMCPSQGLTLTPRQRIVGWREHARLEAAGGDLSEFDRAYAYQGLVTCAACGLCSTACPVGINTGLLTKSLRGGRMGGLGHWVGETAARHYGAVSGATRFGLAAADLLHGMFGTGAMAGITGAARKLSGGMVPRWTSAMPTGGKGVPAPRAAEGDPVVYFPSCAARSMGPARGDHEKTSLPEATIALLEKAGFRVLVPQSIEALCCGMPFDSKGLKDAADAKAEEVAKALAQASDGGRIPVVCDTSPCSLRMKLHLGERLALMDIAEFLHDRVLPRLSLRKVPETVALHLTCSTRRMGIEGKLEAVAKNCAEKVVVPEGVLCCGFAGDKGFTTPELNDHALRKLNESLPDECHSGYSTSRTCEIGLSEKAERPYRSIVHLVNRAAQSPARESVKK